VGQNAKKRVNPSFDYAGTSTTSKTILKVMCQFLSPNPQPADYRKLINTIAPHDSDLTTYVSEVQTHNLQPSDTPDPTLPQSDGFPTPTLQ